jgi:hypothetical protein
VSQNKSILGGKEKALPMLGMEPWSSGLQPLTLFVTCLDSPFLCIQCRLARVWAKLLVY